MKKNLFVILLLTLIGNSLPTQAQAKRPNIIFIQTDSQAVFVKLRVASWEKRI